MRSAGGHNAVGGSSSEIVSLAERMGYLQSLRVVFAGVIMATGLFAQRSVGAPLEELALTSAGYLFLAGIAEGIRRYMKHRGLMITATMLFIDGLFLVWVMYQTGGTQSVLRFLVYVHIVAVTLAASHRTGLKLALWHALLYFALFYAQAADILPAVEGTARDGSSPSPSLFNIVALLMVAVATATFSALNERELRRQKNELASLAQLASALERAEDAETVANILLETSTRAFGLNRGLVLGGPYSEMHLLAFRGPEEPVDLPTSDLLAREVWDSKETRLIKKLDPDASPRLSALLPFARNLLLVPLTAEGRPVGVLVLEHALRNGGRIERRAVRLVEQFAAHASLALRNAWLLDQIRTLADMDALTGIANRRTFQQKLEEEVARSKRSGEPLTLMMLDIDRFKKLNDTHGHQAGDETLKKVADILAGMCRDFDLAARYGGEEFAVILPGCSSRDSLIVAERIRKAINGASEKRRKVTASAGVATFPNHAAGSSALIKVADEALYESKRAGRDRITRSRRRGTARKVVKTQIDLKD